MARKEEESPLTYASVGVNYDAMDPLKRLAQQAARETAPNLHRFGIKEVEASRGESAYVWWEKESNAYRAFVIEGLGTKTRVADETRKFTGKTHYDTIAQDTVAMIVNDLITAGAQPQVVNAYFAVGSSEWFADEERTRDLVNGWKQACNLAGATWGGGETPTLKGVIEPDAIDLSGSAIGIVKPKERLTLKGNKLQAGDRIVLVESSGIHANGLTLARKVEKRLPQGYATRLPSGRMYGEALLTPTHIYAKLINDLFEDGIDIHYMPNITGHGWRKLMRADREFTYVIKRVPPIQEEFSLIQNVAGTDDREMYGTFNMGAGFAIYIPKDNVERVQTIASSRHGLQTYVAGYVEKGSKQVVIKPKNIVFGEDSLKLR